MTNYSFIAFEDLNIKGMHKNHCLAKSISDAAWNKLITSTTYKAESAGTTVVLVNPANTSKMCLRCGLLVEKSLSDRTHECAVVLLWTGTTMQLSTFSDWDCNLSVLNP